jgi:hypothetical protein
MQSHGQECAHNHVDGLTATRFVLSCLAQKLTTPSLQAKVKARLHQLASQESVDRTASIELNVKRDELAQVEKDLAKAARNLALASYTR